MSTDMKLTPGAVPFLDRQNKDKPVERFFVYLQRFNSLVIAFGLLGFLGLAAWGGIEAVKTSLRNETKSVQVPQTEAIPQEAKECFVIRGTDFSLSSGSVVFKLLSPAGGRAYEEGRAMDTRNLMFFRVGDGASSWMFADQSQTLEKIDVFKTDKSGEEFLFVESRPQVKSREAGERPSLRDLHMVKADGSGHTRLVEGVEQTLSRNLVGDELHLVYQRSDSVRFARISLKDLRQISDVEVVKMTAL